MFLIHLIVNFLNICAADSHLFMMLYVSSSFTTVVICVCCVLISIMPIKTSNRSARGTTDGPSTVGVQKAPTSDAGVTENGTKIVVQNTVKPPRKRANVKAMRMSALWPTSELGFPAVSYFTGTAGSAQTNLSFIDAILRHIADKTCIEFQSQSPQPDCYVPVTSPTICAEPDPRSDSCFSDETGYAAAAGDSPAGEPQILHVPAHPCPFHEGVQSVARLLGLLPEHRRRDRDETLKVMVTAAGTERLLFAQGQTARCGDYEDDSPLDLFSVTGFDTSASTLRYGSVDGIHAIEHGMVVGVRNIRHQWILDYKRQRELGLSFYDQRDLVRAYDCERLWGCAKHAPCRNGGFRDRHCGCVCPPGFGGQRCAERTLPEDEDPLNSNCSTVVRSQVTFTLAEIGLQHDGSRFYACDVTLEPPGCMRTLLQVNTSSLRPLRTESNPDFKDSNWCELYFTLMLKHSAMGWRTFCLDHFFNDETMVFMSHTSIEETYGYMKMHIPRREVFPMVANIVFNVTFVEVPECGEEARDRGGAVIKVHTYTVMTAVFCYLAGAMLGVVGWIVMRGLFMTAQEEFPSQEGSVASSGSSSYDSLPAQSSKPPLPPTRGPAPPQPMGPVRGPPPPQPPGPSRGPSPGPVRGPPPPSARPPGHEVRAPAPDSRSVPPRGLPPPGTRPPPAPHSPRPPPAPHSPRPPPESRPPQASRPPAQQETRLPPIAGPGQRLSPRQGGLRASFVQWGGAALHSLRASLAGPGRPQPQGGSPAPPQAGSRPQGARQNQRYKTSPSRPGARRAPP